MTTQEWRNLDTLTAFSQQHIWSEDRICGRSYSGLAFSVPGETHLNT